jgi:hypothetical protein
VLFEKRDKFCPNPGSANVSSSLNFSATTKKPKIRVIREIRAKKREQKTFIQYGHPQLCAGRRQYPLWSEQ